MAEKEENNLDRLNHSSDGDREEKNGQSIPNSETEVEGKKRRTRTPSPKSNPIQAFMVAGT